MDKLIANEIILDMLVGKSSDIYNDLYEEDSWILLSVATTLVKGVMAMLSCQANPLTQKR